MALPAGYRQLEYIEGTGTQYIDTGFKPNLNTRTVIDFKLTKNIHGETGIFGYSNSSNDSHYHFYVNGLSNNRWSFGYGNYPSNQISPHDLNRHTVELNKNQAYIDGVLVATLNTTATSFSYRGSMYLFGVSGYSAYAPMRLYSCRIYDNGTLVRDFVPCKNSSDVVGLYDTVNNQFYSSRTSIPFIGGKLPVYNKALISGSSRNVIGGRALINGAGHDITKGRTLIDGVGYTIYAQNKPTYYVSIKSGGHHAQSQGYKNYAYITINNVKYDTTRLLEVEEGTKIVCNVKQQSYGSAYVIVDGKTVVDTNSTSYKQYTYTVKSNVIVELTTASVYELESQAAGRVEITAI